MLFRSNDSSSSTTFCLIAKDSKVSSTLNPNISYDDSSDDDVDKEDDDESNKLGLWIASLEGETKENVNALLEQLDEANSLVDEKEEIIMILETHNGCHSSNDKELEDAFEKERSLRASLEEKLSSLEETYAICISKLRRDNELSLALANDLKAKNDDACATNSISCEASILKENVELRAQLELLTSSYGKLVETHEKLSSSHEDLLVSHERLKLAHEAILTKVTSCEPHVDNGTTSNLNAILPCASPSNSSSHNVSTSCDELLFLPCCSNNDVSTSSRSEERRVGKEC